MKRIGAVVAVLTAATLGLVGCSSDSEPAEETVEETTSTVEETTEETAAEEEATGESTIDDASVESCLALQEPFAEANAKALELAADDSADPQNVVDMYRAIADALTEVGDTTSDATLAEKAKAAAEDAHALTDALQKVYVDNDFSALEDYTTKVNNFSESYQEVLAVCGAEA